MLRQWQPQDRASFATMNADPRVMQFMPSVLSTQQSDAMAERCAGLIAERGWGFWAVELKTQSAFIGYVGLHIPSADLPFKPCVEIGWRLGYQYWGLGLATEAARAALKVGFEDLRLPEIIAFTALSNNKSQAVMQRLAMQQDSLIFAHPRVPADHPLSLHCLYRLSRQRWQQQSVN
jgi:RimJ/RimL family protein N-acetyltransferase